jgi:hypothetical protein
MTASAPTVLSLPNPVFSLFELCCAVFFAVASFLSRIDFPIPVRWAVFRPTKQ